MKCGRCGHEAPTKRVNFYRIVGAIVTCFSESTECHLCKPCVHDVFWKYTLINTTLGWWSMSSVIMTPLYILSNCLQYVMCAGMRTVSATNVQSCDADASPSIEHTSMRSHATAASGEIVQCPQCRMRVAVTAQNQCPSCRNAL